MKFILIFFSLFSVSLFATPFIHPICQNDLDSIPILQNGRVKPLKVHALESIKHLTGKTTFLNLKATQIFCLLSLSMGPKKYEELDKLSTPIDHVETQKLLGTIGNHPEITLKELNEKGDLIRSTYRGIKEDNSYKKDLSKLMQKIQLYQDITSGNNWTVAELSNDHIVWPPFYQFFTSQKIQTLRERNSEMSMPQVLHQGLLESKNDYIKISGDKYLLELTYINAHLVEFALSTTLLALLILIIIPRKLFGLSLTAITLFIQLSIVTCRVLISGRAPVTNMYETVLFSGFGALLISTIIAIIRKEKRYVIVGLCYNFCTLMMLIFADGMLNGSIGPLVPVLRDNFWLSTHVTCVILSYGALGLSWMMSNYVLVLKRLGKIENKDQLYFSDLIYTCLKVGTTLLALGVILGGVWADYSWGRFWGWDPKETWSLIVLCIYMAILHGKSTSWIPPYRFIPLTSGAFMSVMMAWFGVNYILATGLHSYGFSEGGAIFLLSFFILQISLLAWSAKAFKQTQLAH